MQIGDRVLLGREEALFYVEITELALPIISFRVLGTVRWLGTLDTSLNEMRVKFSSKRIKDMRVLSNIEDKTNNWQQAIHEYNKDINNACNCNNRKRSSDSCCSKSS